MTPTPQTDQPSTAPVEPLSPATTFGGRDLSDEFWRDPMDVDADGNRLGPRSYRKTGTVIAEAVPFPFSVETPEGVMAAEAGDYLVTDDPTTHAWPVKKDVFERTYVEVAPTPTVEVIYGDQPLPKPDTARPAEPPRPICSWTSARLCGDPFHRHNGPCENYASQPDTDERDATIGMLREALTRAREDVEHWASYASDYFTEKWNLKDDLARIDAALTNTEPAARAWRESVERPWREAVNRAYALVDHWRRGGHGAVANDLAAALEPARALLSQPDKQEAS